MNNIIQILHGCCQKWDGSASKTEGEKFVLTWQLPHIDEGADNEKNGALLEERTELADKSLIAAVKIVSEINRADHINSLWKRPEFIAKFGHKSKAYLTFALHMGWTIEGAIGSDSKIDACYLSPHLQATYRIQELCDYYDQQILVSDSLYNLMSLKARNTLRKIDVILMKENKDGALGIFTFDLSFTAPDQLQSNVDFDEHVCGELIKLPDYETINIDSFRNKGVDYMFTLDSDLVGLQYHIAEFNPIFRTAFKCYIQGEWEQCADNIERCLELWENDGPTNALKYFMSFYRFISPSSWNGARDIDEEIDQEKINAEQNFGNEEESVSEEEMTAKKQKEKTESKKAKKDKKK